jgi:RNA polymerase sigma-70 factor (ECF subfamily)
MSLSKADYQLIEQLYRTYYHQLFLYARAILRHDQLAEEAVQDTFHIACGKIADLRRSENSAGWLVQTLKYVLKNMERCRSSLYSSMQQSLPYEEALLGEGRDEESLELLYGGILTREEFHLLKRVAVDGFSFLEAAEELGITVETCRKRFHRAKEKMRKNIQL